MAKFKIMKDKKTDQLKPLKSSLLSGYSYDAQSKDLMVMFKDGTELTYKDVNPDTMSKVFDSPGSIGSKFLKNIARTHKASQD